MTNLTEEKFKGETKRIWYMKGFKEGKVLAINEMMNFINNAQDCGACNLDIDLKEFLKNLKDEKTPLRD